MLKSEKESENSLIEGEEMKLEVAQVLITPFAYKKKGGNIRKPLSYSDNNLPVVL